MLHALMWSQINVNHAMLETDGKLFHFHFLVCINVIATVFQPKKENEGDRIGFIHISFTLQHGRKHTELRSLPDVSWWE